MDPQKAIEILTRERESTDRIYRTMCPGVMPLEYWEDLEAMDAAISALNVRIRRPAILKPVNVPAPNYYCPGCGAQQKPPGLAQVKNGWFCESCGQALKWEVSK